MPKFGHQVEASFLKYLQDNYEELNAVKSSEIDDKHFGTDIIINGNVAVGVTTSPFRGKYYCDAKKASKKYSIFIEVVFDTVMLDVYDDCQWQQAFDNAASMLFNDLPLIGSHVLYTSHLDTIYHHI